MRKRHRIYERHPDSAQKPLYRRSRTALLPVFHVRIRFCHKKEHVVNSPLTHKQLVVLAAQILKRMGYPYILCEPGFRTEMPDALGMSENMTALIECKTSRNDFLADRKKSFRIHPETGLGRQRFYLVNKGVCTPGEIPEGWQLIEAVNDHTVVTEFGDLKKHWKEEYFFEKRNIEEEFRLMCSWAYRIQHNCLKEIPETHIRCLKR